MRRKKAPSDTPAHQEDYAAFAGDNDHAVAAPAPKVKGSSCANVLRNFTI